MNALRDTQTDRYTQTDRDRQTHTQTDRQDSRQNSTSGTIS